MAYELDVKDNALDSFNESLSKFELGENGNVKEFKYAILNMCHFIELVLKLYVISIDENLVFSRCYKEVAKRAKKDSVDLLEAYQRMRSEKVDFLPFIAGHESPHTITLDKALDLAKCEKCSVTGVDFVDTDFCSDIEWIKGLRNDIEHYKFKLPPKEVRLCIGRLVRGVTEFVDTFGLFDLESEVGVEKLHIYTVLADEYSQLLKEAKLQVDMHKQEAYRGVRPKHIVFVEWDSYDCPECGNHTMIPNERSDTGYQCTFCENQESDNIEISCDLCGAKVPNRDLSSWETDEGEIEYRCYYCTGQYYIDKNE